MAEKDGITQDVRAREEEYFRKKDRELIERMKQAAAAEQARKELATRTGIQDPALIGELEELGFTPETIVLLPLVPIVQVAWAEGGVSDAERKLLLQLARNRGVTADSDADRQLKDWMDNRPGADVFARATRLIRAMLDSPEASHAGMSADELIRYTETIASASGGILGIGKVSAEERATLAQIAAALKAR
jgi:tellurite resistance protein